MIDTQVFPLLRRWGASVRLGTLVPFVVLAVAACGDRRAPFEPEPDPDAPACASPGARPLALAVGEGRALSAAEAACLWFAGSAGAEYTVAFADARAPAAAAEGPEPNFSSNFVVRAGPDAVPPPSGGTGLSVPPGPGGWPHHADETCVRVLEPEPRSPGLRVSGEAGDTLSFREAFHERDRPWQIGDEVIYGSADRGVRTARVLRVYGNYLVFMLVLEDSARLTPAFMAALDISMQNAVDIGVPFLEQAFARARPVSSPGSNQLVVIGSDLTFAGGVAALYIDSVYGALSTITLRLGFSNDREELLDLIAHEITHTFQYEHLVATRPPGATNIGGYFWALEGGANLAATEIVRRFLSRGFFENWDWTCCGAGTAGGSYARAPRAAFGRFLAGYDQSASFLRDLVQRRVMAGEDTIAAFRAVGLGAIEGWHGIDRVGAPREGLARRMRSRLGPAWQPADALLTWTLSQALDDMTPNPAYQNRSFFAISQAPGRSGWQPALLTSADATQLVAAAFDAGSTGYIRIESVDQPTAFRFTTNVDGIVWKVARHR